MWAGDGILLVCAIKGPQCTERNTAFFLLLESTLFTNVQESYGLLVEPSVLSIFYNFYV